MTFVDHADRYSPIAILASLNPPHALARLGLQRGVVVGVRRKQAEARPPTRHRPAHSSTHRRLKVEGWTTQKRPPSRLP